MYFLNWKLTISKLINALYFYGMFAKREKLGEDGKENVAKLVRSGLHFLLL